MFRAFSRDAVIRGWFGLREWFSQVLKPAISAQLKYEDLHLCNRRAMFGKEFAKSLE